MDMYRRARGRALRLICAVALAASATIAATASAGAEETTDDPVVPARPLRVMIEGDSITQARNGEASYRYYLWQEFQRQGVDVDFVGPWTSPRKRLDAPTHYWFSGFDQDHAARSGWTFAMHQEQQAEWLTTYKPDVVVLMLGMNDTSRLEGDEVAARAEKFLRSAWAIDPELRFVLGQITETGNPKSREGKNDASALANDLVAESVAGDPRVTIAHTRTGGTSPDLDWDPARHTFDGTHANATGDTFLAHRFAQALHEAGFLPQGDIDVYRPTRWDPRPRTQVAVDGREVTFSWFPARLRLFNTQEKVRVTRLTGEPVATSRWRDEIRWTTTLPRGRYVVQVAPRKGTMTGRYGVPIRFRVL